MCEVEIYGLVADVPAPSQLEINLALNKTAWSSSTYNGGVPERGTDGNFRYAQQEVIYILYNFVLYSIE